MKDSAALSIRLPSMNVTVGLDTTEYIVLHVGFVAPKCKIVNPNIE